MKAPSRFETLAVETFSVVLGVLLALGANAWREDRRHAADAHHALETIRAELATNRDAIRAKLPYHRAMHDSLAALVASQYEDELARLDRALGS
jgi:hypothetical protein